MLSLSDINFNFAVAVEGYIDKELKIDPRYVKFMANRHCARGFEL